MPRGPARRRSSARRETPPRLSTVSDQLALCVALLPMAAYVYGTLAWGWGFNELSGAFFAGGLLAGLIGGLGLVGTATVYLEGMQSLLPAALLIGVARSITIVLSDGHIIDSLLHGLATPLGHVPAATSAFLMIPFHALVHVPVPSVSGQAVLTMPVLVPLADLLGLSRQVPVLAYQIGAGLMENLTPTNGGLMAVLAAASLPYGTWVRFALVGCALCALMGVVALVLVVAGVAG